ncbi:unnamed protein product [Sphagnum jensenii]|uniref:Uncharacterized protein n=1 Tax=Sphagnum jensenii TaxID=128206 RepID=A0ABP0W717_9BRYO
MLVHCGLESPPLRARVVALQSHMVLAARLRYTWLEWEPEEKVADRKHRVVARMQGGLNSQGAAGLGIWNTSLCNYTQSQDMRLPVLNSRTSQIQERSIVAQDRQQVIYHSKTYTSRKGQQGRNLHYCKASTLTERFNSTEREKWENSRNKVEEIGFNSEDADKILSKSFCWSYSSFWGEDKGATVPEPEAVVETLGYLKDLGVDLPELLTIFPEVVGLSKEELKANVAILDASWGITGNSLKNVITRNPSVLGNNVDCKESEDVSKAG